MIKESVLITGGAGYIGSVLSEHLLNRGYKVTVLDNLSFGYNSLIHLITNSNFEFIYGDVRDEKILKKIVPIYDVIIPLAAIVGAPQCDLNPIDAKLINRDSVILINEIREKNQKLIYPNTNSGYGTTTGEIYCTEETPLKPISIYGKTKCEAEEAIVNSKKDYIVLRLATVFGISPRMRTDLLVNYFVFKAISDGYIVIYEKDFKRNYIHVKDVARCFEHCILNFDSMKNNIYNVGLDSANLSKQELAEKIKEYFPKFDITYKEINKDPDKRNYIVSNKKLINSGFTCKYDLNYGIEELKKGYNLIFKKEVFRQ
ncbi:MAG: SDR family oxidoreductase [Candidatus Pacearchaeota archaeon]